MDAVTRGLTKRPCRVGNTYRGAVDMAGGSHDDAVAVVGHVDDHGRFMIDCLIDQGAPPPLNPRDAVRRFVSVLREYHVR